MNRYQRGQNLQLITMPQEASLPLTYITNYHCDKTDNASPASPVPSVDGYASQASAGGG
jgi:hypothetical protein